MGREFVVREAAETGVETGPIPDDTILNVTLLGTESSQVTFSGDPGPTERIRWKFRIEDEPYFDRYVFGSTGADLVNHPNCKIYAWIKAILGLDVLPLDYRIQEEDLWQRRARVLVGARDGKDKKTGEDRVYNYVEEVLPAGAQTVVDEDY